VSDEFSVSVKMISFFSKSENYVEVRRRLMLRRGMFDEV
jgi:hypothetical protein